MGGTAGAYQVDGEGSERHAGRRLSTQGLR